MERCLAGLHRNRKCAHHDLSLANRRGTLSGVVAMPLGRLVESAVLALLAATMLVVVVRGLADALRAAVCLTGCCAANVFVTPSVLPDAGAFRVVVASTGILVTLVAVEDFANGPGTRPIVAAVLFGRVVPPAVFVLPAVTLLVVDFREPADTLAGTFALKCF